MKKNSAGVDGGLSEESIVRIPGSKDIHWLYMFCHKHFLAELNYILNLKSISTIGSTIINKWKTDKLIADSNHHLNSAAI